MIDKYDDLNLDAKEYFYNDSNNSLLFLFKYLEIYKNNNKDIKFIFKDNEIFTIEFINGYPIDFINFIHRIQQDFRFIKGYYKGEDETFKDCYLIIPGCSIPYNMYLKYDENEVPELDLLSTVEDFRKYKNDYLVVKMKYLYFDNI